MLGFQTSQKNDLVLEKIAKKQYKCKRWFILNTYTFLQQGNGPINGGITNEMDANDIMGSNEEEESEVLETTYPKNTRMDSEEEHEAIEPTTPRSQMGSNNVNNTFKEYGSTQFVWCKEG